MVRAGHAHVQACLSNYVNPVLIDEDQATLYDRAMIGSRFRKARDKKGLTLKEVGTAMGVSAQAVGQWEKTNPQFSSAKTNIIANLLEVDFEWLEGEIGNEDEIIPVNNDVKFDGTIPFVNKLEAITFSIFAVINGDNVDFRKGRILPTVKLIGRGFAFAMDDDSMLPMIQRDDILLFDPAVRPNDDDIVFAITYENGGMINPVIRLYNKVGEDAAGNVKVRLDAMNEAFPSVTLNDGAIGHVFAVMVEMRMIRPRGARLRR